ncbi:MAG: zinc-binding dehydrogenase [Planctomycetota bacterium]
MSSVSLAAVYHGTPGAISLQTIATPQPANSEILVTVEACTLCGSDLHSFEGRRAVPVPTVLGHEIVGRIVEFGPQAPRADLSGQPLAEGDRVVWAVVASCGRCSNCRRDLPQKCEHAVKYGHEAFRPGYELLGGLADHCLLTPGTAIVKAPETVSLNTISPASCATSTIAAAMESAGPVKDRVVCITGAGLLGLTAAAMCRVQQPAAVVLCDVNAERRSRAAAFGATHATTPEQLPELLKQLSDGRGADVAIEVSGAPAAFQTLWPLLRIGARLVLVGAVFPAPPVSFPMDTLVRRNLTVSGIHNYGPRHLLQAVRFLEVADSQFPFASLVSDWFPLSETAAALNAAMNPACIRIGIQNSNPPSPLPGERGRG